MTSTPKVILYSVVYLYCLSQVTGFVHGNQPISVIVKAPGFNIWQIYKNLYIEISHVRCCHYAEKRTILRNYGVFGMSCSFPFTCMEVNECNQLHEKTEGIGSQILFKCYGGRNKLIKVCCPPLPGYNIDKKPEQFLGPVGGDGYSENKPTASPAVNSLNANTAITPTPGPVHIDLNPTQVPLVTILINKTPTLPKPITHRNTVLLPDYCGISLAEKITSGENASRGEFPFMVLLVFTGTGGGEQLRCGGTIISSFYILTAAHCFDDPGFTLSHVRLGEYNLEEESCEECLEFKEVEVDKIIIHENYNNSNYRNDIALLRLKTSSVIPGRGDIAPICLPLDVGALNITKNTTFEAAGWGLLGWTESKNSKILQKVNFTNNEDECRICDNIVSPFCPIPQTQMCIEGKRKKDVCRGDSGGPLMMTAGVSYYQIGIISFKFTNVCAEEGVPSIFTRVHSYVTWILDHMEP